MKMMSFGLGDSDSNGEEEESYLCTVGGFDLPPSTLPTAQVHYSCSNSLGRGKSMSEETDRYVLVARCFHKLT